MTQTPAGWYADPKMTSTQRYWDGERWTEQTAPAAPPVPTRSGPSTWTIARGVALGVAAVIAGLVLLNQVMSADDGLDCATENAERALDDLPTRDCD